MPVERRPESQPQAYPELVERIAEELSQPTESGPRIIEEKVRGLNRYHVTVIWDGWAGIDPADRSTVILDAYEKAFGPARMLEVSIGLGLTPAEAQRIGVA